MGTLHRTRGTSDIEDAEDDEALVVQICGARSVAVKPFWVYPPVGLLVAVVAAVLVMLGGLSATEGLGLALAALLISLAIALTISASWLVTGCRVCYAVTADEVIATRGSAVKARYPANQILDAGLVDMLGWDGLLFSYPWPEFPYLWLRIQDSSNEVKEVRLPGIAIWGDDRIAGLEREIRACILIEAD